MYVVLAYVYLKAANKAEFEEAALILAAATRKEAGNVRYDFSVGAEQTEEGVISYTFYEAYSSENDFKIHGASPHFNTWLTKVSPFFAKPLGVSVQKPLFFGNQKV